MTALANVIPDVFVRADLGISLSHSLVFFISEFWIAFHYFPGIKARGF
jgi:hypothetical protein